MKATPTNHPAADADGLYAATPPTTKPRKTTRLLLWLLALPTLLLLLLLALAPAILSGSLARRTIVARINASLRDAEIDISDWSWHWLAPCKIEGVRLHSTDKTTTLVIREITSSRGLAAWLARRQDFGTIVLESPEWQRMEIEKTAPPPSRHTASPPPHTTADTTPPPPPAQTAQKKIPVFLNPFGTFRINNGRGAIFPVTGPVAKIDHLFLEITLAGRSGPVSLGMQGTALQRQGSPQDQGGSFELQATTDALDCLLLAPLETPFEANLSIAPLDISTLFAFAPPDENRPSVRSGLLQARLQAHRLPSSDFTMQADVTLQQLELAGGRLGQDVVHWEQASLKIDASGRRDSISIRELDLLCPWAQFKAAGLIPTPGSPAADRTTRLTAQGRLDLAAAAAQLPATMRLRPGLVIREAELTLDAELTSVEKNDSQAFLMLRCAGIDALRDSQPAGLENRPFSAACKMTIDPATRDLRHGTLRVTTPGLAASFEGTTSSASLQAEADIDSLTELANSLFMLDDLPRITGKLNCSGDWQKTAQSGSFSAQLDGRAIRFSRPDGSTFDLPEPLLLSARGSLKETALHLNQGKAVLGFMELEGSGNLTDFEGEQRLALDGTAQIDMQELEGFLRTQDLPDLPEDFLLRGKSRQPFSLSLPLRGSRRYQLSSAVGDAGLQILKLEGAGLKAADLQLLIRTARGTAAASLQSILNQGTLQLETAIDLLSTPPLLSVQGAPRILSNAHLTGDLLNHYLARAHPVLKGCAVAEGRLDLDLERLQLPLAPDATGLMSWEASLNLRNTTLMAAGPLEQLANALHLKNRSIVIPDQTGIVECHNGKITSHPLELTMDGHIIQISGTVGLDGSLQYFIKAPLTPALTGTRAWQYLEGQTITIPLTGSAAKPMLDFRALEAEVRQLIATAVARGAADDLRDRLKDVKSKSLKKLLK